MPAFLSVQQAETTRVCVSSQAIVSGLGWAGDLLQIVLSSGSMDLGSLPTMAKGGSDCQVEGYTAVAGAGAYGGGTEGVGRQDSLASLLRTLPCSVSRMCSSSASRSSARPPMRTSELR